MKTIMIPIQPKYAELEMNGKKTIEVRKFYTEPPFKVCNYVTYGMLLYSEYPNGNDSREIRLGKFKVTSKNNIGHQLNGKVAYEYVVKYIEKRSIKGLIHSQSDFFTFCNKAGFKNPKEFFDYAGKKEYLYLLHISDLKIYDKPKELGEFRHLCKHYYDGNSGCEDYCGMYENGACKNGYIAITKPPQNFIYIEEIRCCQSEESK